MGSCEDQITANLVILQVLLCHARSPLESRITRASLLAALKVVDIDGGAFLLHLSPHFRVHSAKKFQVPFHAFRLPHSIMPRPTGPRNGLKLPAQLEQELGIRSQPPKSQKGGHGVPQGRKGRRRAEREEKKVAKSGRGHGTNLAKDRREMNGYENGRVLSKSDTILQPASQNPKKNPSPSEQPVPATKPNFKSILKKTAPQRTSSPSPSQNSSALSRSPSPALVLDSSSKAFKDRAVQDDAEISALEKKLGLKTKKLPKSFDEDGLGDLLEGLDTNIQQKKRKSEEKEWLQSKRRRAEVEDEQANEDEGVSEADGMEFDLSDDQENDLGESDEGIDESDCEIIDFEDFGSEEDAEIHKAPSKQRENPYIAPVASNASTAKYIPPSRRKALETDTEALQRLRRQVQGYLNKLSEANLVTILSEIEKLYQSEARQDVTTTLTDLLLLGIFCDPSALQSTFIILHAAFVAAIYKIIGTDFGAEIVSGLVERLDDFYLSFNSTSGKQAVNLISIISHLYTFRVIGSRLVFDYIRLFLEEMSEANTELLLRVVRDVGPQLRQDDPSSLKDMIRIMQNSAAKLIAGGQEMSVRTKFMIDTITDLKNNKVKGSSSTNRDAIEHITRMRKVLGTLNTRNIRASEPLRLGRADIRDTEKKGKWWLVGASWKGTTNENTKAPDPLDNELDALDPGSVDIQEADLLALARQYRMNTSVRRSIFIAIMSASDCEDAHLRLLKLRLKRSQEQEIPKVLMRCAGAETTSNPYYSLIAKKLCTDKRMKMAFQFSLWDFFKRMGEKGEGDESDGEDEETQDVELTEVVNVAKMYAGLVAHGALSLTMLKTLNLTYLKEQAQIFVELLLVVIILQSQEGSSNGQNEEVLRVVFGRAEDAPQIVSGLQLFMRQVVAQSDLAVSRRERSILKWGSKVAIDTLKMLKLTESALRAD